VHALFSQAPSPDIAGGVSVTRLTPIQGVHPFGQVVIILPVPGPIPDLHQTDRRASVRSFFCRILSLLQQGAFAFLFVESADPAGSAIVITVAAE